MMAGLFDALLAPENRLGLAMLANSGPSAQPMGFGQRLANSVNTVGAQSGEDLKRQLLQAQIGETQAQADQRGQAAKQLAAEQALAMRFQTPGGGFDMKGYASALAGVNPKAAAGLMEQLAKANEVDTTPRVGVNPATNKPDQFILDKQGKIQWLSVPAVNKKEVTPGGVVFDPYDVAPGTTFADPNKPFAPPSTPGGAPVANLPFQNFELSKSTASAPRISNNVALSTEKTLLGTIADKLGGQIDTSLAQANNAGTTLRTTAALKDLLNSNKLMVGPTSTPEVILTQIGNSLGIGGKDGAEKLANTRLAMQNLAKLEMEGAQDMKGQGAITEPERALIKRSAGGDINMTLPELKALTNALDKAARFRIQQHNEKIAPLMQMPGAAALKPFMQVAEPAAPAAPAAGPVMWNQLK